MEKDLTKGGADGGFAYADRAKAYVLENTVDFSANPADAGDVLDLFNLPPGALVLGVGANVHTAEGAAATLDLGDDGSGTAYATAASVNGEGRTFNASTKFYGDEGVVKATAGTDVANARVTFSVVAIDAS